MDYGFLEDNRQLLKQSLRDRSDDTDLNALDALNQERKALQKKHDEEKSAFKELSKQVGQCFQSGDIAQANALKAQSLQAKQNIQLLDEGLKELEKTLKEKLLYVPNILHPSVPLGKDETDNVVVKTIGTIPNMPWAKSHDQLGVELGLIDFERASKLSGSRFSFLLGWGARLERALANFMLDVHQGHGYQEISVPLLVHEKAMRGTGQLPKFSEDAFCTRDTDHFLIPTAEVPVTNFFADEVLTLADLPYKFVCYSPCFRKEAGSYGKDTKGLMRQHQFHKVELVQFVHCDQSYDVHEALTGHAEKILELLELPYRRVLLCSGDTGFSAAKTYDLEVWLPSQNTYREISSCSNFEDFQAQRANIKFKDGTSKKNKFVHTLNGSGLAIGRTLLAVIENHQQEDGSIKVPTVLQSYVGCTSIGPEAKP